MYISYKKIPQILNIQKGDVVLLTSRLTEIMYVAKKNKDPFSLDELIDSFIEAIGPDGTLLIPTYNWDFCKGIAFDWKSTPSKTGILGQHALQRDDFKRTRHPIYSYAVAGKDQGLLCALNNISSFGADSPFAYMYHHNGKNAMLGINMQNSCTFVHHVEEMSGNAPYRYLKTFTGTYVGPEGVPSEKGYSMFVRDLDLNVEVSFSGIEDLLLKKGALQLHVINGIKIWCLDMADSYKWIMKDILDNKARKITTYIGQND